VRSLRVEGTARPLQLETRAGQPLDPAQLERDVRKLWAQGTFDDILVVREETPEGTDLVFRMVEKPRLYLNKVRFAPGSEQRRLEIKEGTPIDTFGAQQVAAVLRRQLTEDGHPSPRVEAALVPTEGQKADLVLNLEPGERQRIRKVEFTGELAIKENELREALDATRPRTVIPLIWKTRAPLFDQAVQADLARLRSVYLSKGYLDSRIVLDNVAYAGSDATLTISIRPGPRYGVTRVELVDVERGEQRSLRLTGEFPTKELCACLLDFRRESEKEGKLDFDLRLEVAESADPPQAPPGLSFQPERWVDLSARVDTGPAYTVGRIEFRGNTSVSDSTVRRAFKLEESKPFDPDRLRRSLVRINNLNMFEPVSTANVQIRRDPASRRADVMISLKQRSRGRWFLSGPVGPFRMAGPLQAAVTSRLPAWGQGLLEASTYYLTFSMVGFANPFAKYLSFAPKRHFFPMVVLERPYLPGQGLLSGFSIAPQLGWQGMLAGYGITQGRQGLRALLGSDTPAVPELVVPVERAGPSQTTPAGFILCKTPKGRWHWLKVAGTVAGDLLLAARPY
jgi:hypothetical protein